MLPFVNDLTYHTVTNDLHRCFVNACSNTGIIKCCVMIPFSALSICKLRAEFIFLLHKSLLAPSFTIFFSPSFFRKFSALSARSRVSTLYSHVSLRDVSPSSKTATINLAHNRCLFSWGLKCYNGRFTRHCIFIH